ncbi:C-type lectin domain family 4 member E [Neoarius graeffei]|uniref:C-type lectin domain family 4 member E n=1 Tax=Neoarius graeffei TaxID=443677 RepID=UPI00298CB8FC|nr:C-type lectin domain family 4 member E [Neoarius graeffei]
MKRNKQIYCNVTATSTRGPGSGKRCIYCVVISCSVLLVLSLIANALLAYFYVKLKWASDTLSEQARKYSAEDCKINHATVTSREQIRRCSAGERQIQYKDRLYIFPKDEMNWISSRKNCQEFGGDLVVINSKEEHKFLVGAMNTFSNSLHWIGLRNAKKQGTWLWVDETPLLQNCSWWTVASENSVSVREDCVGYYDGQWVDLSCSTSERRICEIICTP